MARDLPPKILIVEDEEPIARALELKLQKEGYSAKMVYDGASALELLAKEKFDLIILDLILPQIDGFTVLEEFRKKDKETPVIVASNLGQPEDLERAKNLGGTDYFIKSNTPIAALVENIRKRLNKK